MAEDIDFALAVFHEGGTWQVQEMILDKLDDVASVAGALRRFPADHGAVALVAVDEDFFLIVRVTGATTRVLLSDITAADEWELAASVVERLGLPLPDDDDEEAPAGDLDLLGELGVHAIDLAMLLDDDADLYPDEIQIGRAHV